MFLVRFRPFCIIQLALNANFCSSSDEEGPSIVFQPSARVKNPHKRRRTTQTGLAYECPTTRPSGSHARGCRTQAENRPEKSVPIVNRCFLIFPHQRKRDISLSWNGSEFQNGSMSNAKDIPRGAFLTSHLLSWLGGPFHSLIDFQ